MTATMTQQNKRDLFTKAWAQARQIAKTGQAVVYRWDLRKCFSEALKQAWQAVRDLAKHRANIDGILLKQTGQRKLSNDHLDGNGRVKLSLLRKSGFRAYAQPRDCRF